MTDMTRLWTARPKFLADTFARASHEVRLVGGPVRCALAGETPNDEDLCTDATPIEMLRLGARLGLRSIPMLAEVEADPGEWDKGGLKHGTVPFLVDGEVLEVTTLRVDTETDGRHAQVEFVRDFKTDAARRDFTFNAMSVDRTGRLHDHFGGAEDLRAGIVRFVGDADARIREDYLRILRYYRFRGRYGSVKGAKREDGENSVAISRNVTGLDGISGERIWSEMARILSHPAAISGQYRDMALSGVVAMLGLPFTPAGTRAGDLAARSGANPAVVAGMLFTGSGASQANLIRRWRMSSEDASLMMAAASLASLADAPFGEFLDLALRPRSRPDHLAAVLTGLGRAGDAQKMSGELPEFPVKGADLIAAGMTPGPEVGVRLTELRDAWRASGYTAAKEDLMPELKAPAL